MTVEERARGCAAQMGAGDIWNRAIEAIETALREQIEECAKIADGHFYEEQRQAKEFSRAGNQIAVATHGLLAVGASRVATEIRALAGPTEEGKESER